MKVGYKQLNSAYKDKGGNLNPALIFYMCVYMHTIVKYDVFLLI